MTNDPVAALPGRPPVVDLATWQAARDELLVREKAHTREGDAIAAARRRMQCEGCTVTAWHLKDAVYLNARGVSFAILTPGRGTGPASGSFALLDMTPYGRGEAWQASPDGWPEGHDPCWYWRSDAAGNATWGPTSRPVQQWTRPGATPAETLGRHGHQH